MAGSHNETVKDSSKSTPLFDKPENGLRLRNVYLNLRV